MAPSRPAVDLATMREIERRALWLSVRMVDYANSRQPTEVKVGGHQASSASVVSILTALWIGYLQPSDKVAVKPHASPVFHAMKYLLGDLDAAYLRRLRDFGGLQAYPSRTKDPDQPDFSTGSVGLGAVAPLFAAAAHRYAGSHFGLDIPARYVSIVGDAELDEGNVWEAIADPALTGLGNVMLVVDLNRQSLDRVVPGIKAQKLKSFFRESGWDVCEAKYGRLLESHLNQPGGDALRAHIDHMSNEEYQSLFSFHGPELRQRFLAHADPAVKHLLEDVGDQELSSVVTDLGGHDLDVLLECFAECDAPADQPSVVFAYTVKGWGLPIAGDYLNHSTLLGSEQIDELRRSSGLLPDTEWDRFDPSSAAGAACEFVADYLRSEAVALPDETAVSWPDSSGATIPASSSTQDAFGRVLVKLGRIDEIGDRVVTASPDVAISTNLGAWINERGVFSPRMKKSFTDKSRILRWEPGPLGQHIELGISEMNLFLLLGMLGMSRSLSGESLLPVGTVYDPFVLRGLDGLIYSLYNGGRFVVVGTPSGVTLAPEGGAHQSTVTPSVMAEMPSIVAYEPAFGLGLDWILTSCLEKLNDAGGSSAYLRLSTRPIDQAPLDDARSRLGDESLRAAMLKGGYRLVEPGDGERVILAASGAVMPEVLKAADLLGEEGVGAAVIDVTSLDLLYRGWKSDTASAVRAARPPTAGRGHIGSLILHGERRAPSDGLLVVQGGPGTGKTIIGLQRISVLIFRDHLEPNDLLFVGPTPGFLSYISHVLPSLGDGDAMQLSVSALSPVRVRKLATEPRPVARTKGDARMVTLLERALRDRRSAPEEDASVVIGGVDLMLTPEEVWAEMRPLDESDRPHSSARDILRERLIQKFAAKIVDTTQSDSVSSQLRNSPDFTNLLDRIWPTFSPQEFIKDLLASERRLLEHRWDLFEEDEMRRIARPPQARIVDEPWTAADLALIDEADVLINGSAGLPTYRHVVVDEAQDLSPMQFRSIARRSRDGLTILGDLAQATGAWAHRSWDEVLGYFEADEANVTELTMGYRVPSEVMELARPVAEALELSVKIPQPVRDSGEPPVVTLTSGDLLMKDVVSAVQDHLARGRKVGLIADSDRLPLVRAVLDYENVTWSDGEERTTSPVTVVTPAGAKGLEFDAVVIVEPAEIRGVDASGLGELFVALTRTTSGLSIVHSDPLPSELSGGVLIGG